MHEEEEDKVPIKSKVQIKQMQNAKSQDPKNTYHRGTGRTWTGTWMKADADRDIQAYEQEQTGADKYNDRTRSAGNTQTKYTDTDEQTRNRRGERGGRSQRSVKPSGRGKGQFTGRCSLLEGCTLQFCKWLWEIANFSKVGKAFLTGGHFTQYQLSSYCSVCSATV